MTRHRAHLMNKFKKEQTHPDILTIQSFSNFNHACSLKNFRKFYSFNTKILQIFPQSKISDKMPEVTGTISDPHRKKYYIMKAAGSPAAEIFAFYARKTYEETDIMDLGLIPVLMGDTESGSSNDANAGVYITGQLKLQDVLCNNGDRVCFRTKRRFVKQATLEPQENNILTVTAYLRNGEMLVSSSKGSTPSEPLIYAISPILIGQPDDLATPLGLALLKERLKAALDGPQHESAGPSSQPKITFEPNSSDDSGQEQSSGGNSSNTSSIISGNQTSRPSSSAERILCGEQVERSLNKVLASNLDSNFSPWMSSTGNTPPSQRPRSAQSLPTDLEGSNSSEGSPQRPRSTSPTKGRKRAKKSMDKAYKQPSIRNFLQPSPPTSPTPKSAQLPPRPRRRSQRLPPLSQTAVKRTAKDASLDSTQELTIDRSNTSEMTVGTEDEILLEDPAIIEAAGIPMDTAPDRTENISVEYLGEVMRPALREPFMTIDLDNDLTPQGSATGLPPPMSASSSRTNSIVQPSLNISTDVNPIQGPSHDGINETNVTFHTNLPIDETPHHVFVKAINKHLSVGFLTFPVYNLRDIVKAFFEEREEHDNPDDRARFDATLVSGLATPDDTLQSNNSSLFKVTSQDFTSTSVRTFVKEERLSFSTESDPQDVNRTIVIDDTRQQIEEDIVEQQHQTMMIQRDMSILIQDVRTAGDSTLEKSNEASKDAENTFEPAEEGSDDMKEKDEGNKEEEN